MLCDDHRVLHYARQTTRQTLPTNTLLLSSTKKTREYFFFFITAFLPISPPPPIFFSAWINVPMVDSIIGRWESPPARKSCHKVYPLLPNGKSMYRPQKDCIDYKLCIVPPTTTHGCIFRSSSIPYEYAFFYAEKK